MQIWNVKKNYQTFSRDSKLLETVKMIAYERF